MSKTNLRKRTEDLEADAGLKRENVLKVNIWRPGDPLPFTWDDESDEEAS